MPHHVHVDCRYVYVSVCVYVCVKTRVAFAGNNANNFQDVWFNFSGATVHLYAGWSDISNCHVRLFGELVQFYSSRQQRNAAFCEAVSWTCCCRRCLCRNSSRCHGWSEQVRRKLVSTVEGNFFALFVQLLWKSCLLMMSDRDWCNIVVFCAP